MIHELILHTTQVQLSIVLTHLKGQFSSNRAWIQVSLTRVACLQVLYLCSLVMSVMTACLNIWDARSNFVKKLTGYYSMCTNQISLEPNFSYMYESRQLNHTRVTTRSVLASCKGQEMISYSFQGVQLPAAWNANISLPKKETCLFGMEPFFPDRCLWCSLFLLG